LNAGNEAQGTDVAGSVIVDLYPDEVHLEPGGKGARER